MEHKIECSIYDMKNLEHTQNRELGSYHDQSDQFIIIINQYYRTQK